MLQRVYGLQAGLQSRNPGFVHFHSDFLRLLQLSLQKLLLVADYFVVVRTL